MTTHTIRNRIASALLSLALVAPALALAAPDVAVAPQYDTTHVYVANADLDAFVNSFVGTFGGKASPRAVFTVTPTPSKTASQYVQTPVGMLSVFAFQTPIPYGFGNERTGYLVTDINTARDAAVEAGADVVVEPFDDPIGKDVLIQWAGGVNMQLYWHTKAPSYAPLHSVPDNRVYVSKVSADKFVTQFKTFAHAKIVADGQIDGGEIGRAGDTIRRVKLESKFGKMTVFVTDGKLTFPYGRETTGYQVDDMAATLEKAAANGATVLAAPRQTSTGNMSAMLQFPGGYISEIHDAVKR
ncbi:putative enzyme related to lactoylglutathione lyase [Duganella sp. 3397]|uniref:VOC family protein n=1 Tax=Duganella sp. 3397 TaxID=2817732 RepID=UPI002858DE57|nr:glyoxalase [Duganella sp. 3397]MDR7047626.1 putative enzyme related to lactoylglutathione lyase [Duganella sp. 3397]